MTDSEKELRQRRHSWTRDLDVAEEALYAVWNGEFDPLQLSSWQVAERSAEASWVMCRRLSLAEWRAMGHLRAEFHRTGLRHEELRDEWLKALSFHVDSVKAEWAESSRYWRATSSALETVAPTWKQLPPHVAAQLDQNESCYVSMTVAGNRLRALHHALRSLGIMELDTIDREVMHTLRAARQTQDRLRGLGRAGGGETVRPGGDGRAVSNTPRPRPAADRRLSQRHSASGSAERAAAEAARKRAQPGPNPNPVIGKRRRRR